MSYRHRTGPEIAQGRSLVRQWLSAGGYTHRDAADVLGVPHGIIEKWASGRSTPNALDTAIIRQDIISHGGRV